MKTVYLAKNNYELGFIQRKYFKKGIDWLDAGKNTKPIPLGKIGTLIGESSMVENSLGYYVINSQQEMEYAKSKVFIRNAALIVNKMRI